MKISPVQLRLYLITRVSVEPFEKYNVGTPTPPIEDLFDWDGVTINSNIEFGWGEGQGEDPRAYAMRLTMNLSNDIGGKLPLYRTSVEIIGYFSLIGEIPLNDREDIARVNGASLLWGVVRELLFSLTTRFPKGALILPSVNFHDLRGKSRPSIKEQQDVLTQERMQSFTIKEKAGS
jgi:preprotein translocase subunit SecB